MAETRESIAELVAAARSARAFLADYGSPGDRVRAAPFAEALRVTLVPFVQSPPGDFRLVGWVVRILRSQVVLPGDGPPLYEITINPEFAVTALAAAREALANIPPDAYLMIGAIGDLDIAVRAVCVSP